MTWSFGDKQDRTYLTKSEELCQWLPCLTKHVLHFFIFPVLFVCICLTRNYSIASK